MKSATAAPCTPQRSPTTNYIGTPTTPHIVKPVARQASEYFARLEGIIKITG